MHMLNDKVLKSESEASPRPAFNTIDDAIQKAQELVNDLKKLGERKYPLDVRRGSQARKEVVSVQEEGESKQIKASTRTYFLDVKPAANGKSYLKITESRMKGKGGKPERNSIVVFQEDAEEFASAISEMVAKLK